MNSIDVFLKSLEEYKLEFDLEEPISEEDPVRVILNTDIPCVLEIDSSLNEMDVFTNLFYEEESD